jgi:hypothetical protein
MRAKLRISPPDFKEPVTVICCGDARKKVKDTAGPGNKS